jgi:SAM-dependent methyltransferase
MHLDVQELYEFYHSGLGQLARRLITHHIRQVWPDVSGDSVLGTGFAAPFMRPMLTEARRVILAMPEEQGVIRWPHDAPSRTFLSSQTQLPLADASINKVLAVHALEACGGANAMLRELWRVLAPEGRILLIVPNRRGIWARFDTTPFGQGHPYSRRQLERLLSECLFAPIGWAQGLFMPPLNWRVVLKTAVAWERAGLYAWPSFSGVLMVEAQKHLYAPLRQPSRRTARKTAEVPVLDIMPQSRIPADQHPLRDTESRD